MTSFRETFESWEPYLFKVAMLAIVLTAAFFGYRYFSTKYVQPIYIGSSRVVVFDAVKLANAQRKIAATFLGKDPGANGDAALLMEVQGNTAKVIRDVAGPGTLVLLKQAVIHTDVEDITDEVLRRLKLPVDVPTQTPPESGLNYAPTVLGSTPMPPSANELRARSAPLSEQVLP